MSRATVLVVEDHDDLRSVFTEALALAGFAVREARDGLEALRIIDSSPPGLVVLDLDLPNVTGLEVLYELKEHIHTRQIPVVVVTGRTGDIGDIPADCVLRKPVDPFDLIQRVQACISPA